MCCLLVCMCNAFCWNFLICLHEFSDYYLQYIAYLTEQYSVLSFSKMKANNGLRNEVEGKSSQFVKILGVTNTRWQPYHVWATGSLSLPPLVKQILNRWILPPLPLSATKPYHLRAKYVRMIKVVPNLITLWHCHTSRFSGRLIVTVSWPTQ